MAPIRQYSCRELGTMEREMEMNAKRLIQLASQSCDFFMADKGEVYPHVVAVSPTNDMIYVELDLPKDQKQLAPEMIRKILTERKVKACILVAEAYRTQYDNEVKGERKEIVCFLAEDHDGQINGYREILRDGTVRLGPLVLSTSEQDGATFGGDFSSLLPRTKQ